MSRTSDKPTKKTLQMVEDAEWMFLHGEHPDKAAERLGVKLNTLQKSYARTGTPWPWAFDNSHKIWYRVARSKAS